MKKFIAIFVLIIAAFAAASCGVDDFSSLQGSTWLASATEQDDDFGKVTYQYTLVFDEKTFTLDINMIIAGDVSVMDVVIEGKYTYDKPDLVLTADMNGEKEVMTGTREGRKIVMDDGLVYKKR